MTDQLNLIRAGSIRGLPVVTIDTGDDAAEIRDVVYDAGDHHLVGFTLNRRGWFRGTLKSTLGADDVVGIGADAVMVASHDCLTDRSDSPASLRSNGTQIDVIDDDVISSSGTVIGKVVDVIVETGPNPHAVGYEITSDSGTVFIPSSAQMSVSGDQLLVPAEAEGFFRDDLVGFGGAVQSFRDRLTPGERS